MHPVRQLSRAERVEEVGIKNEKRNHLPIFQCLDKWLVIGDSQVLSPEPYQRSMDLFHGYCLGAHYRSAAELPQRGNETFL